MKKFNNVLNLFVILLSTIIAFSCGEKNSQTSSNTTSTQQTQTTTPKNQNITVFYIEDTYKAYPAVESYIKSAQGKFDVKDYKGTIKDFQKAIDLISVEKHKAIIYYGIGMCYQKLYEIQPAIKYYQKAIDLCPEHPDIKDWKRKLNSLKNF